MPAARETLRRQAAGLGQPDIPPYGARRTDDRSRGMAMDTPPRETIMTTGAEAVAAALQAAGVARLFGVPGGGSSLDLVAAAEARGIPVVLARQESAAVIMAATEAELSGRPESSAS